MWTQDDLDTIIPGLYISSIFPTMKKQTLQKYKVTHIVTVAFGEQPRFPESFKYKVVPISDTPIENIIQYFAGVNAFIDDALQTEGNNVLVHCHAGISRSATVCIAYLMHRMKIPLDAARRMVETARSMICPNGGFVDQLQRYEKLLQDKYATEDPNSLNKYEKPYENKCEECQEMGRQCFAFFGQKENSNCANCRHLSIRHIDQRKVMDGIRVEGDLKDFTIDPLATCPHLEACIIPEKLPELPCVDDIVCQSCKHNKQNWICISCYYIMCGRSANGHMKQHAEVTDHKVVASFKDLQFWCYVCENYISEKNKKINSLYILLHTLKFGYPPIFET